MKATRHALLAIVILGAIFGFIQTAIVEIVIGSSTPPFGMRWFIASLLCASIPAIPAIFFPWHWRLRVFLAVSVIVVSMGARVDIRMINAEHAITSQSK